MEVMIDCIPCHIRQAISAARSILDDNEEISEAVEKVLKKASCFKDYDTNFRLYVEINDIIKEMSNGKDPYREQKKKFNDICLSLEDELISKIKDSKKPFETAVRIALAGNVIDIMQGLEHGLGSVRASIEKAFSQEMDECSFMELRSYIEEAKNILYIGDNAGEIVFDKIFIDHIIESGLVSKKEIIFAVRGGPTINDVTVEDADYVGLSDMIKVIDTGAELPFAYLPFCSKSFNEAYKDSDLVISKGMGNFEGLMKEEDKDIFFLLKIKCGPIQKVIGNGTNLNDIIILKKSDHQY